MSETIKATVEKVYTKTGETNGREWTRYDVKAAGKTLVTFKDPVGRAAQACEEHVAELDFYTKEKDGRTNYVLEAVRGPLAGEAESEAIPVSNGGSSRKMAPSTEEQVSIWSSVALQQAVATFAHTVSRETTAREAAQKIEPLAASYLLFLKRQNNALPTGDDDIPF